MPTRTPARPSFAATGCCYLFSFPFWVYINLDHPPQIHEIEIDNVSLRVYPPFRSAPANFISMPSINPAAVPFLPSTRTRQFASFRTLAGIPLLGRGDTAHLTMEPTWPAGIRDFPMDCIRIDTPDHALESAAGTVHKFLATLLTHLRYRTRQWWIGRSQEVFQGYLRNAVPITPRGGFANLPEEHTAFRTVSGHELAVDGDLWHTVVTDVAADTVVPLHGLLLLDAEYYAHADEPRRAVMDSCTAIEVCRDLAAERLWLQKTSSKRRYRHGYVFTGRDLPKHIGAHLDKHFGRSYERECLAEFKHVEELWFVRGRVAHGLSACYADDSGQLRDVDNARLVGYVEGARHCVGWLVSLEREEQQ